MTSVSWARWEPKAWLHLIDLGLVGGALIGLALVPLQRPGVATLTRDLRRNRSEAFARARSAMESRRFRLLVLDLAAWIEAGD